MTHHGCRVQMSMMRTIADFSMELELPDSTAAYLGGNAGTDKPLQLCPIYNWNGRLKADHATLGLFRIAWPAKVFPSDQMAPGTRWLLAITESNALRIQSQSALEMVRAGRSLTVWLAWPATWLRILWSLKSGIVMS